MLSKIKNSAAKIYNSLIANHRSQSEAAYDRRNVSSYLVGSQPLSADEKSLIKQKWGHVIDCIPRGFDYFRGIKALSGFNPNYLPSSYFFPYIEGILNPEKWKRQLSHKSMIEMAYGFGIRHPRTILRSYGGMLLDENYKSA